MSLEACRSNQGQRSGRFLLSESTQTRHRYGVEEYKYSVVSVSSRSGLEEFACIDERAA